MVACVVPRYNVAQCDTMASNSSPSLRNHNHAHPIRIVNALYSLNGLISPDQWCMRALWPQEKGIRASPETLDRKTANGGATTTHRAWQCGDPACAVQAMERRDSAPPFRRRRVAFCKDHRATLGHPSTANASRRAGEKCDGDIMVRYAVSDVEYPPHKVLTLAIACRNYSNLCSLTKRQQSLWYNAFVGDLYKGVKDTSAIQPDALPFPRHQHDPDPPRVAYGVRSTWWPNHVD